MERVALSQRKDVTVQRFPSCPVDRNCPGFLLKYSFPGPCLGASDSVGLGWAQEYVFLISISGGSSRESLRKPVFKISPL